MPLHRWALTVAVLAVGLAVPPTAAAVPTTIRVSLTDADGQGNVASGFGTIAISASGRYVVFESRARLVPADTNTFEDVYVRDVVAGSTSRVSVDRDGSELDDVSFAPVAISPGGRWIAYETCASELADGNCGGTIVYNQLTGQVLPRVFGLDVGALAISRAGRYVAEDNGGDRASGVVRTNVATGTHQDVSVGIPPGAPADFASTLGGMSANGRFVLFTFFTTDPSVPNSEVFVRDLTLRRTRLVSVSSTGHGANRGATANAISSDGRARMFTSTADNLIAGDTNEQADVFVRMRGSHRTRRVSVSSTGHQANGRSRGLALSATGRFSLFWSDAPNLVASDTNGRADLFVHDGRTGRTVRVDLDAGGRPVRRPMILTATISADGAWVAWTSRSPGWVPGDTNGAIDVFARGPLR